MPKYLVTGGAGFIGSHIVEHLVRAGESVRVLDNFLTGKRANIEAWLGKIELFEGDIRDDAACRQACHGVEVVFHQAALPSVPVSVADPITSHQCNVNGTMNMLVAAREAKVRRFVYAASSSAYGDSPVSPKVESMPSLPLSPYAVQKLAGELYCRAFAICYGMETVSLRYFNVFGPRQDPKSQYAAAIPAFVTTMLRGHPPTIYGDGEQTRDFTFVENVVRANLAAAAAPKVAGEVVNVACGESISLNRTIEKINQVLGTRIKPVYDAARAGDVKHSMADIRAAKALIGFSPEIGFEDGLRRSIDWYRAHLA